MNIIDILALIVALIAFFVSYKATLFQKISLIDTQLSDKAKECNNNLDISDLSAFPKKEDKVSGILSAIITGEEILALQVLPKTWIFSINRQLRIDLLYLQLHTTIREFLKKDSLNNQDLEESRHLEVLKKQFLRCKQFLAVSIQKNEDGIFEKLHTRTNLKTSDSVYK